MRKSERCKTTVPLPWRFIGLGHRNHQIGRNPRYDLVNNTLRRKKVLSFSENRSSPHRLNIHLRLLLLLLFWDAHRTNEPPINHNKLHSSLNLDSILKNNTEEINGFLNVCALLGGGGTVKEPLLHFLSRMKGHLASSRLYFRTFCTSVILNRTELGMGQ